MIQLRVCASQFVCKLSSALDYINYKCVLKLLCCAAQAPASPGPSTFPALPDMSPKKVSAKHNVYVSPLPSNKVHYFDLSQCSFLEVPFGALVTSDSAFLLAGRLNYVSTYSKSVCLCWRKYSGLPKPIKRSDGHQ